MMGYASTLMAMALFATTLSAQSAPRVDKPQPQVKLHRFEVGDEWNYKYTYTLYQTRSFNGIPWPVAYKSVLDARFRVVKNSSNDLSDKAFLITVKGKTAGGAKIDLAGLVAFRQNENGAVEVVQQDPVTTKNSVTAACLPGEWSDGISFEASWVGDWLADVFHKGVAAIRGGSLLETIGDIVVDGVDVVKTHAGKFVCWIGKRVRFTYDRVPTSNNWYFAPEVGLPVRSVTEFPVDAASHFTVTWDLESTNVVPRDPKTSR